MNDGQQSKNGKEYHPTGKFSYFKKPINAASPICPHTNIGFDQLFIETTNDSHKFITSKLRDITDKAMAKEYKEKNFPYITPNGTCTQRNQEYFNEPSGFFIIDLDDLADIDGTKERLLNDPELKPVFLFVSPSGNGIKAFYNIDVSLIDFSASSNKMHKLFYSFNNYINIFYSDFIKPDQSGNFICVSGKDLLRPCFVCHDLKAYYNPGEKSAIDQTFFSWYYKAPQQQVKEPETFTQSHNLAGIAEKHLIPDSHHPQILRFACACLHYDMDPVIVENFIVNSNNISAESSYYNNSDQTKALVKDVYCRYQKTTTQQSAQPERSQAETPKPPEELETLRQAARINLSDPITEPPIILEIEEGDNYRRFASLGDFSVVTGKAKSKKTFFIATLVAACIKNEILYKKIVPRLSATNRNIIVFDTEQSRYDVQSFNKRVLGIAGLPVNKTNPFLDYYHLKRYDTATRVALIEYILYNTPGVALVVIDGIRDLIFDINDPKQATYISDKLMKWADELNIHIITVLHQNKGDNNARGHVGTELTNKAETVVSVNKVDKDPILSIVKAEQTRGREFKDFAFLINIEGLPEIVDRGIEPDPETRKKIIYPNDFPPETHKLRIEDIFKETAYFKRSDMIDQIKAVFGGYKVNFGDNKAREFLTHWVQNKWIEKGREDKIRWEVYKLTQLS